MQNRPALPGFRKITQQRGISPAEMIAADQRNRRASHRARFGAQSFV
jgi:hypothetical protein